MFMMYTDLTVYISFARRHVSSTVDEGKEQQDICRQWT